ncbi:DUF6731 family protein [Comamonas terrigena]|uniref:DUF6731 family protein n=1 Tax=Comamonas terrigena TaxID=32013 RepID=UPI0028AD6E13|nr:DUF6731 family protein [Comamonas terrigena]
MAKSVSIHLFDISWPANNSFDLTQVIENYRILGLSDRWRDDIRLDSADSFNYNGNLFYLLNFSKRREIGPGKLGFNTPVQGVNLGHGFNFGEETTALYYPQKKALLVLYNHYGIGVTRMMEYFNSYDPGNNGVFLDFIGEVRLNAVAHSQYNKMKQIDRLYVTATIDALSEDQHTAGVSLSHATKALGGRRISFTINANEFYKNGDYLRRGPVKALVNKLLGKDSSEVSVVKVKGRVGQKDKIIDLIEQKLTAEYTDRDLQVLHNKYTLDSKKDLLLRCFNGWSNIV